jgi:hypothetical protein
VSKHGLSIEEQDPIELRDRLLLGLADLSTYGIRALPAVTGTPGQTKARLFAEIARAYPDGMRSYAFWTADDDRLFDSKGRLPANARLNLHLGHPRDADAIVAILDRNGVKAMLVDELRLHILA